MIAGASFCSFGGVDMDYDGKRYQMVEEQLKPRGISSPRVLAAFTQVPREIFVLPEKKAQAYEDFPLSIGLGQTISQPFMVALMTQLLDPQPGEKILEIGTGSGYQTAILSCLGAKVWTVERLKLLAERAQDNLSQAGYKVFVKVGDGSLGWKEESPFDKIAVTAAAPSIPPPLLDQLKEGGKLVIPRGGLVFQNLVVVRKEKEIVKEEDVCRCIFVPLVGKYGLKK